MLHLRWRRERSQPTPRKYLVMSPSCPPFPNPLRSPRGWAWLAWLAIFSFSVVPTASRVITADQGGSLWAQVCSAQGTRWIDLTERASGSSAESSTGTQGTSDHGAACPLCVVQAQGAAPAVAWLWTGRRLVWRHEVPAAPKSAPPGHHAPLRPPSRAPPFRI